eukprot:11177276-Lingulodinium_polyedra.AAC.1
MANATAKTNMLCVGVREPLCTNTSEPHALIRQFNEDDNEHTLVDPENARVMRPPNTANY